MPKSGLFPCFHFIHSSSNGMPPFRPLFVPSRMNVQISRVPAATTSVAVPGHCWAPLSQLMSPGGRDTNSHAFAHSISHLTSKTFPNGSFQISQIIPGISPPKVGKVQFWHFLSFPATFLLLLQPKAMGARGIVPSGSRRRSLASRGNWPNPSGGQSQVGSRRSKRGIPWCWCSPLSVGINAKMPFWMATLGLLCVQPCILIGLIFMAF